MCGNVARISGSEVQPGRRRGDGAGHFRENRLIPLDIARIAWPPDVRRKRDSPPSKRFSSRSSAITRSPPAQISSTRAVAPLIFVTPPTRIFRPGLTRHFHRAGPSCSRNRNSILPSSENLRALITRVLFRTSKSPGERNSPSSANFRCSIRWSRRCSTIIRDSSRLRERPLRDQLFRQRVIVVRELRTHSRNHRSTALPTRSGGLQTVRTHESDGDLQIAAP